MQSLLRHRSLTAALAALLTLAGSESVWAQPRVPALPSITAIQCSFEGGGRFSGPGDLSPTWASAREMARQVADRVPDAAIAGVQGLDSREAAGKLRELLSESTRGPWLHAWTGQGRQGSPDGLALFWRSDRVTLERDLGKAPIDFLDDGTVLHVIGGWFRQVATGRTFGFFTARLASPHERRGAMPVSRTTQRWEAWRVREFVWESMIPHPDDARILAIDLESSFGSSAWFELRKDFEPDGDKRFTVDSSAALFHGKRYDFLFWDGHAGPRFPGGVLGKPGRSEHFGSAHRFVWAALKL
ncbi:MAG: hypothetical protein HY816_22650 [Candidatus Wallbacteria bacterium]|nr:hypothetical protein [Candidatus Wallbacteria bacterium]